MKRTKEVKELISNVESVKVFLEDQVDQKQSAYDNKSEKWQESEKGEEASQVISNLEEARDEAESLMDKLIELYPED